MFQCFCFSGGVSANDGLPDVLGRRQIEKRRRRRSSPSRGLVRHLLDLLAADGLDIFWARPRKRVPTRFFLV